MPVMIWNDKTDRYEPISTAHANEILSCAPIATRTVDGAKESYFLQIEQEHELEGGPQGKPESTPG